MQSRVDITREPARDIDRAPKVAASKDEVGNIAPRAPEADDPDAEPAAEPSTSSSSSAAIAGPSGSSLPLQKPVSPIAAAGLAFHDAQLHERRLTNRQGNGLAKEVHISPIEFQALRKQAKKL